ncbi:uncharacterized protein LOC131437676 [Malaya genurostris]|uniref:uncharacterized protein LOC131437676 n=1 Tax=Malaya genurostris TaxID=325434 RepID=UPI0026F39A9C|nr:uncharacterized protein LOC131437676 [Malaya genurostris]
MRRYTNSLEEKFEFELIIDYDGSFRSSGEEDNVFTVITWVESKSYTDVETETGVDEEVPFVSSVFDEVLISNPRDKEGIASVEMLATRKQQTAQDSNMTLPIYIIITYFYLSLFSYLFVVENMKPLFSSSGDLSIFTHSGNRITLSDVPAAVPGDVDVGVNPNNESIIAPTTDESNECSGDTFEDALGVGPEDWNFPVSNRVPSNISEVGAAAVRSNQHADLCYPAGPSSAICDPVSVIKSDLSLVVSELNFLNTIELYYYYHFHRNH